MVSVILPTYNRENLLLESVYSVLQQGYGDLELIILDDGSDDDTREKILAIPDKRIRYYPFPHSGYTGRLKNFGIRQSSGEYIAFIDSDDTWKPDKLERQLRLLADNPSIGFSITDVTTFREDTILLDHSYHLSNTMRCGSIFQWMSESRFIVYNPTLIIRKGCLERTGYFSETMRSGDYNFNMHLAYYFDAGVIYEPLVMRRVHDSNMSRDIPLENYSEYLVTFDELYTAGMIAKKYRNKARGNAFFKMGKLYAGKGRWQQAREHYMASLKYAPLAVGHYREMLKALGREEG